MCLYCNQLSKRYFCNVCDCTCSADPIRFPWWRWYTRIPSKYSDQSEESIFPVVVIVYRCCLFQAVSASNSRSCVLYLRRKLGFRFRYFHTVDVCEWSILICNCNVLSICCYISLVILNHVIWSTKICTMINTPRNLKKKHIQIVRQGGGHVVSFNTLGTKS